LAASAEAQTSSPTGTTLSAQVVTEAACTYPFDAGLITSGNSLVGAADTCWTAPPAPSNQAVIPAPPTDPTTPSPSDPTTGTVSTASPAPVVTDASTSLAFTGADVWQSALLGIVLIGGGIAVVRLGRRRRSA
jgi:hypothetical protein